MSFAVKKRILCVDDSQDNNSLFSFVLDSFGYEVETAETVVEALQQTRSGNFKLYLIDLSFPDGTGFDLIQSIRSVDRSTPIIVCSGSVDDAIVDRVIRAGAQVFLRKPIEIDSLMQTVGDILGDKPGG